MLTTSIAGLLAGIAIASAVGLWAAHGASAERTASRGHTERRRAEGTDKNRPGHGASVNSGNPAAMKLADGDATKNEFASHAR